MVIHSKLLPACLSQLILSSCQNLAQEPESASPCLSPLVFSMIDRKHLWKTFSDWFWGHSLKHSWCPQGWEAFKRVSLSAASSAAFPGCFPAQQPPPSVSSLLTTLLPRTDKLSSKADSHLERQDKLQRHWQHSLSMQIVHEVPDNWAVKSSHMETDGKKGGESRRKGGRWTSHIHWEVNLLGGIKET